MTIPDIGPADWAELTRIAERAEGVEPDLTTITEERFRAHVRKHRDEGVKNTNQPEQLDPATPLTEERFHALVRKHRDEGVKMTNRPETTPTVGQVPTQADIDAVFAQRQALFAQGHPLSSPAAARLADEGTMLADLKRAGLPLPAPASCFVDWWSLPIEEPDPPEIYGVLPLEHYSSLYGPWGGAKSWLLAAFMAEAGRLGHRVVLVDREATAKRFRLRMHKLGVTADVAPFIRYARAATPEAYGEIIGHRPALVLIDSVSASGGGQGEREFMKWHGSIVGPLLDAGIAVCAVDHDNKQTADPESGRRLTRGASGAHEKADRIQGVGMWLTGQSLERQQNGDLRLVIDKDNDGRCQHREWRVLMERSGENVDERIAVTVRPRDSMDVLRDTARLGPQHEATIEWMRANGNRTTAKDLSTAFDLSVNAAKGRLDKVAHDSGDKHGLAVVYLLNPQHLCAS